ncbi:DUF7261 family protein [Natronomonas marina]|uniref:DUF7261 family protein n=1 Tax=Natronomonas marina TaxID=2961939 RepID=UPI0020C9F23C|nr:hypothetical protein [Natronomonas marina]
MGLVRVERGQLVLVAAAVVAIGLVPILLAYLQLGYHPDVAPEPDVSGEEAVDYLDRSVHDAADRTAGEYAWGQRAAMADAVRDEVDPDIESLETARLEEGVTYVVRYNDTAAAEWIDDNCVTGDGKRFGNCAVDGGVASQERAGEAVLLAVAFDVRVVGPDGETTLTVVVDVGGG